LLTPGSVVLNAPGRVEVGDRQATAQPSAKREFYGRHALRVRPLSGKASFTPLPPVPKRLPTGPADVDQGVPAYSVEPDLQMGLLNVTISRKQNSSLAPRGSHGLPKRGKELIEDGLVFLFNKSKKEKVSPVFWTATLPTHYRDGSPLTQDDLRHLLGHWAEVIKRTFEELTRELERLGLPTWFLYVTELQENRLMPHIHAILPNRYAGSWKLHYSKTDEIFGRVVSNLLGNAVDVTSACRLDPIHGMSKLSDYLVKFNKIGSYMSKGSKALAAAKITGMPLPKSWYGSDLETKKAVRDSILTVHCDDATMSSLNDAINTVESDLGRTIFSKPFLLEKDGLDWICSALFQVKNLTEIDLAFSRLLPILCDTG
jgi:hypothetical protein